LPAFHIPDGFLMGVRSFSQKRNIILMAVFSGRRRATCELTFLTAAPRLAPPRFKTRATC
jgi:hypothetical protein